MASTPVMVRGRHADVLEESIKTKAFFQWEIVGLRNQFTRHMLVCSMVLAAMCVPETPSAKGLGHLLHRIEKVSLQLHAAAAVADASAAGIRVAKSQYWGHAEVFARDAHYDHDRLVNPIHYPPELSRSQFDSDTFGYGAAFTLPLDIDRRITARVQAQQNLSMAAKQGVERTRLTLFGQAVILYRGLQRLEGINQALNQQLKALQGHRKITETAVQVGRVAKVELLRIEAEIQALQGQLAGLDGDEARIRAGLGALLDQPTFSAPIETLSETPPEPSEKRQESGFLAKRPDIHEAKSITEAEGASLREAEREWMPTLSLHAETMRNQGYTADGQNTWSVTGQLSWQFWDGGRRFARTDQARANQAAAHQRYLNTINEARAELQSAAAASKAAALQYQATTSGLEAARETERIQSDLFVNGRISAVDLVDAEAALARARADHTSALADWWLADDQLHLAGGEAPSAYNRGEVHERQ